MKVVLTGGPSSGKTSITEVLDQSDRERFAIVQEAASLLYRGGFPRSMETAQTKSRQYAIYAVQKALEETVMVESKGRTLVCDRGSLDGLAYWPASEESFFSAMNSSMSLEIERYEWVIHLDTARAADYQNSEVRLEKSAEAAEINEKVKNAWREHPRRLVIPNSAVFTEKLNLAVSCLALIRENRDVSEIRSRLDL